MSATIRCPHCQKPIEIDVVRDVADDALTPEMLRELWNTHKHASQIESHALNPALRRHARARIKELPDRESWIAVVKEVAGSKFHQGENDRGWRADIEYLLRPKTWVKALDRAKAGPTSPTTAKRAQADTRERNTTAVGREDFFRGDA